jgi:hypothetical protein
MTANRDATVTIGATGLDTEKIVASIEATVARKMQAGAYSDPRIARAEKTNLAHLSDEEQFAEFYLDCLREGIAVDINDFEIVERRRGLAPFLVRLKKAIWQLLKFYTYRLWSQQNQINALLLTATENIDHKYRERIRKLEERIATLEKGATPPKA